MQPFVSHSPAVATAAEMRRGAACAVAAAAVNAGAQDTNSNAGAAG